MKTKLYAKKTLSVFLSILMLMTCWVWIAPEKAEAATQLSYHVKLKVTLEAPNKGGHIAIFYYPIDSNGNLDTSNDQVYYITYSNKNYSAGTHTFDTADNSTRNLSGDVNADSGAIPGWPFEVKLNAASGAKVLAHSLEIGSTTAFDAGSDYYGAGSGSTKYIKYDDSLDNKNWNTPALSKATVSPSSTTISVPKGGSNSATFTADFYDQYGVEWPGQTLSSASFSSNLGGVTVATSNNTATVTANEQVFANSGYNSSNGQISATLNMVNGKTGTANITFQSPKYNATLKYTDGTTAKQYNEIGYYNQSVTLTDHPANSTPTSVNEQQHQPYIWPANSYNSFNITNDTTFTEAKATTVDHNFDENGNGTTDAGDYTIEDNEHKLTCSVCGYVKTQEHIRNGGYVTKEETCTEDGEMTYDCAICGKEAIATSVINKITGHDFTGDYYVKAEGENGTHWQKCSRCDAYGMLGTAGKDAAHDWDKNGDGSVNASDAVTVASTCHSQGSETYTCKVCQATWTKTLDYASHTIVATAAKDVTNVCGGDGNVAFWSCSVCNRVWKDSALTDEVTDLTDADSDGIPDVLEVKGPDHSFTGAYVSASAGKDGTHHRQCARFTQCNTYGPEEKHTWGTPAVTEATCEKAGKKVYTCTSGCGQTYEETIDKVAHNMIKHDAVEAKCGVAGSIEYYSCSICGKNYSDENGTTVVTNTVVPALEHKWTAHHDYDTLKTPATCMAAAVYYSHCDYCKVQIIGAEHSYGTPDTVNGHNFSGAIVKNDDGSHSYKCTVAGCTEAGAKTTCAYTLVVKDEPSTCHTLGYTITKCEICGNENRVDKTAYDFDNHNGEEEVRFATEAKCNTNGYTGDTYCLGCNTKIKTGSDIVADKTVHPHEDMKTYDAKPATCQTEGWKEYKYCSACGTYETAKETVPVRAHKFTTYTSNGNGTHTATCDTCDAAVATPATDTQPCAGGTANCQSGAICTVCNTAYGEEDENNHVNKVFVPEVPATCQKEGTEAYYKCADCGVAIGTVEKLEKLPHVYSAWISNGDGTHTKTCSLCDPTVADPATETEACNGGTAYCDAKAKCADCKAEYGEKNPVNHSTTANHLVGYVKETCQAPGYTGNYLYDCCNALKQQGEEIAQLAHTFSIEVEGSRVAATCITKGEVTYKCSTCVESEGVTAATQKKELAVDAKNHKTPDETVTIGKKDATCESDGYTGDIYYSCCYDETKTEAENKKALKEKGTVIKANGQHVYQTAVPEYMLELDEDGKAVIVETVGEDGKPVRSLKVKATEPDYAAKIAARHADGKWYHVQICDICNEVVYSACYTYAHTYNCVDTDKCEVCKGLCSLKDADKHDELEEIEGKAATHTEDGTKAYYKCKDCGKFFLDDAGKKEFDPESAEGKKLLVISKDTVPCTSWEEEPFETVEPKCGKDGYKKYRCTVEGCTKVKTEIIPAEGETHVWSTDYKEIKAPTCGAVGYEARYCTLCGEIKPNSAVTIDPTGEHNYDTDKNGKVDINDAEVVSGVDCQHPGTITYTCVVCGNKEVETDTSGVSAHQWSANEGDEGWVVVGGDCSTGVSYQRTCLKCNATEQKFVSGGDHEYEIYKYEAPTPEKDGYVIYECVNCKFRTEPEVLKYAGGEGEEPDTPPVTPEEPEEEHIISADNYIVVEEANCEHAELREYTCLDCGEKVRYYVGETKPHVWLSQAAEQATCSRDGHNEYYRCVRCLAEYGRENYPATGHVDGNGDGKCDECSSAFYEGEGGTGICSCMCHKTGFMAFIFKIVNFFWKLFKINPSCACGNTHY